MRRCDCFQTMLSVTGDAELHERRDCVILKLPDSKVLGIMATMKLLGYSVVDCGHRQQFCNIISVVMHSLLLLPGERHNFK